MAFTMATYKKQKILKRAYFISYKNHIIYIHKSNLEDISVTDCTFKKLRSAVLTDNRKT